MHWKKKFGCGVLGGFCLVIVRLLSEGFFVSREINLFGVLGVCAAALATMLLAGIWTITEDDDRVGKLIKFGFAAPGLLLLLVGQGAKEPHKNNHTIQPSEIPEIADNVASKVMDFVFPAAMAQDSKSSNTLSVANKNPAPHKNYEQLNLSALKSGFASGSSVFVGLPVEKQTFACVVAKTDSDEKAAKLVKALNDFRESNGRVFKAVKIDESKFFLVIAGSPSNYSSANGLCFGVKLDFAQRSSRLDKTAPLRKASDAVVRGGVVDLSAFKEEQKDQ